MLNFNKVSLTKIFEGYNLLLIDIHTGCLKLYSFQLILFLYPIILLSL